MNLIALFVFFAMNGAVVRCLCLNKISLSENCSHNHARVCFTYYIVVLFQIQRFEISYGNNALPIIDVAEFQNYFQCIIYTASCDMEAIKRRKVYYRTHDSLEDSGTGWAANQRCW